MARSRLRGAGRVRRILKKLPEAATAPVKKAIREGAAAILQTQLDRVPRAPGSGALARNLTAKISSDGFSAKVGLNTRRRNKKYFYARFLEFGTKGYAPRKIPPLTARPFMIPAFNLHRDRIMRQVTIGLTNALRAAQAAGGSRDD